MKIILAAFFVPFMALGSIQGSPFSSRHQEVITKAVEIDCGAAFQLNYLSHSQIDERVDQGIIDTRFRTKLEMIVRVDQGVFDFYRVVVHSSYFSQFDHAQKDWGHYSVDSVTCELQ